MIKKFSFMMMLVLLFASSMSFAQLTGIKTIPGDYASIAAAIADLNTQGVGSGGVTFNVAAGHLESTTDSLVLTATGTSSNPIIFQKSGSGVNPKITRTDIGTKSTSTLGGQGDAVITIQGSDYVTFDGIDVSADSATIEYGYYIRKGGPTDGCKFVTIKNATITMNKGTSQYVVGIYSSNNDANSLVSSATGITVTSVDGRNENITIIGNTIQNVFTGIVLRGFNHTTAPYDFYDQNFVVGQSGGANTIINYAGNSANTAYGVYAIYHNNLNVSHNVINNISGGGSAFTSIGYGIFHSTGTLSSFTANANDIDLTTQATGSSIYGINNAATGNLTIENNRVKINTAVTTTGTIGYIYNSSAAASLQVSISNNVFVGSNLLASTGAVYLIYNNSSQLTPGVTNVSGNSLEGALSRAATTGATYCYYNNGSPTGIENIFNNVFDSITTAGTGALYGLLSTTGSSHTHHFYNNIISDFNHTGTGTVYGIHRTLASGSVYGNTVKNLTGGGTIWGLSNGSGNVNVYKNNVYNLTSTSTGTTAGLVTGIYISALTNIYIYNNFISDLKAPAATGTDAIRGIGCIATTASTNLGIYYNTIFLNASSSGADFGSSGIFHTYAASTTSAALDMRNNVIINLSTPSGTGRTVAFRRSASTDLLNYSTLSNNNAFYAGTPGTSNLIYFDGTNADQTLAQFKARVAPRESNSVTENVSFVNSTTSPYDLHINTTIPTQLESGGIPISTPIAINDDFDGDIRGTFPDIGADEFTGTPLDLVPPTISYNLLPNAVFLDSTVSLTATITDLSGVATGANSPRLYIKKINDSVYVFDDNPSVSGNDYTFTINYSAIGGVAIGDTIQYYVAAQDINGNAGTNPAGGSGSNPPGTTPPLNPNFYIIINTPLSGTYTVGLNAFKQRTGREVYFEERTRTVTRNLNGVDAVEDFNANLYEKDSQGQQPDNEPRYVTVTERYFELMENGQPFNRALYQTEGIEGVYPTLTEAVNDLLLRGVSGPVTFQLVDSNYPNENYPINLTAFNGASSTNTVTIKPAPNVQAVIPGNASQTTASIWLQSGGYYIIDGSNTNGGTSRDLTIRALGSSPAVHFYSSGNNNVVKNCIIESQNTSTGSGSLILAAGTGSNDNLIENCLFQPIQSATPYAVGVYLFSSFTGTNNLISKCEFKDFSARAITIQGAAGSNNNDAVGNLIYQTTPSTAVTIQSIYIGRAENTDIIGNQIYNLQSTNTSPTIAGIYLIGASGVNMTVRLVNNVISFGSQNPAGTIRGIDYFGYSANSLELYYNSVLLSGSDVTGTIASSAIAKRDAATNFIMIDNIFSNSRSNGTGTGSHYAVQFSNTTATTINLNYNDYFANGTGGVLGQWGTTNTATLTDWQTASTQDANSLNANPQFASLSDLRPLFGSAVIDAGTPVPGITTDILGAVRDTLTPTLGAYENPTAIIGWANLQWPPTDTIYVGGSTTVYAQIWIDGITNLPGPGTGIQAWIGINSANTDPSTWTNWIPAVYNVDVGNNDEYMANIGATLTPGTYYYASRFNVFGGNYVYGGYSAGGGGFWDGINNVSGVLVVKEPLVTLWQRSVATSNLPTWFGTDFERGLAYGKTSDGTEAVNDRVFVVSRTGGLFVRILDAATGNDVGTLNTTGISGGTFALNDIGVTEDGKIIGANLTLNASTSAFKFYIWNNEASAPDTLFSYLGDAVRLGDKFTVVGNYSAGTAEIWAASATTGQHKVYKWTMSGGVFNPVPQVIQCSDNLTTGIGSAAVGPLPNGDFYWNANGQNARKYQANGTLIGIIPGTLVATGTNAVRYLGSIGNDEYVAIFAYGTGNNNARVLKIPNGDPTAAVLYGVTPSLGSATNTNGAGDVDFKVNPDLTVDIFVLATNNGVGAYRTDVSIPVELTSFVANVNDRDVLLNWSTATETNNLGFEVERKASDNGSWNKIAFIKSAGTTTEPQQYSYRDSRLESGKYSYRLKIVDLDGTYSYSDAVEVEIGVPQQYALSQNYPNPFNPSTRIDYQLPFDAKVQIDLYSITGEKVATLVSGDLSAGYHTYELNASRLNLSSGVYFYRISASDVNNGKFIDTKKLVLLK